MKGKWPKNRLERQIIDLLGEDEAHTFFEHYGGTRIYIPDMSRGMSRMKERLKAESLDRLAAEFGRDFIRCPLSREFLCRNYVRQGLSIRKIARLLRITETGVLKMVNRLKEAGVLNGE